MYSLLSRAFFFLRQKTASEMRIRDWSSDVCSSDLRSPRQPARPPTLGLRRRRGARAASRRLCSLALRRGRWRDYPGAERRAMRRDNRRGGRSVGCRAPRRGTPTPSRRHILTVQRKMRSEEHTSELQSLMRISYAVFCLKKKNTYIKRPLVAESESST